MLLSSLSESEVVLYQGLIAATATIILAWIQYKTKAAVDATGLQIKKSSVEAISAASEASNYAKQASIHTKEVGDVLLASTQEASNRVDAVKHTLAETTNSTDAKLDELTNVANSTHILVNSNMGEQLKLNAILSKRIYELTTDPIEKAAAKEVAEAAEKLWKEHIIKQDIVDKAAEEKGDI